MNAGGFPEGASGVRASDDGPDRRAVLVIGHIGLAAVLAAYFGMVALNSTLFSYSFWNEEAPTDAAESFANNSLWALFGVTCFVAAVTYGAMAAHADGVRPIRRALGWSFGAVARRPWLTVPATALALVASLLVVPIPTVASWLAPAPLWFLHGGRASWPEYQSFVAQFQLLANACEGAKATVVAAWIAAYTAGALAAAFDGFLEDISAALVWASFVAVVLAAGGIASSAAALRRRASEG